MYCTLQQLPNADCWLTCKLKVQIFTVCCLRATYTVLFISFDLHSYTLSSFIRLNYLIKYSQSRRNLQGYYKDMAMIKIGKLGARLGPPPPLGKIIKNMPRNPKHNISRIPHPLERI